MIFDVFSGKMTTPVNDKLKESNIIKNMFVCLSI